MCACDFETTLRTEFTMLFGEFLDGWGDDPALQRELQVFTVLYLLVLFWLVSESCCLSRYIVYLIGYQESSSPMYICLSTHTFVNLPIF